MWWSRRLSWTPRRRNSQGERWSLIDDQTPTRCKWLFSLHLCVCKWVSPHAPFVLVHSMFLKVNVCMHDSLCVCISNISIKAGQEISKTWRGPIQPWVFHIDLRVTGGQKNTRSVPSRWKQGYHTHTLKHTYTHNEQSSSTMSSLNCWKIQIHPQQTLLHTNTSLIWQRGLQIILCTSVNNRKWHYKSVWNER